MKTFKIVVGVSNVLISHEGAVQYCWPITGPDRRFTRHLLDKFLSLTVQHWVLVEGRTIHLRLPDNFFEYTLDIYLPPAYRRLSPSLWDRFINLFKKENRHARNKHDQGTQ